MDKPMMPISICITTYQSGEVLIPNIERISESYPDIEFCITDNFSNDNTYEKIKKLNNDKIKIKKIKSTRGKGRNIAVETATSEIILIIDADVYINNIEKYLDIYISKYYGKILNIIGINKGSWAMFITKSLFLNLEGFPDLN
ncbi:glycosyltransferase [Oxyplasma meridianum]|uniref:Glycosyltransferase n=1 Tax=Oxyplasma meridianum TaxID=3073602 RepID=A0AAX4NGT2_9ARCH